MVLAGTKDLFSYMKDVEDRAGLAQSSTFPSSPSVSQRKVLKAINERLRFLNNRYYFIFRMTEYNLTTTDGVDNYDLSQAPYSQNMWRPNRTSRGGLRDQATDIPMDYVDFTEMDRLKRTATGTGRGRYYSANATSLILSPTPNGQVVVVRYYGRHIGTDAAGTAPKTDLTLTDDLPLLDDEWQDVLIVGAAATVRQTQKPDAKYNELKQDAEKWENTLNDMMQPGEEANPRFMVEPYMLERRDDTSRYFPFFTARE